LSGKNDVSTSGFLPGFFFFTKNEGKVLNNTRLSTQKIICTHIPAGSMSSSSASSSSPSILNDKPDEIFASFFFLSLLFLGIERNVLEAVYRLALAKQCQGSYCQNLVYNNYLSFLSCFN
jgi:hypothetical protein